MAAAVAYRTIFAIAPLLMIAVGVFGHLVGSSAQARQTVLQAIERFAGEQVATVVETLMISASSTSGVTAVIGLILFFWTSSTMFLEVQDGLNDIFGVPYEKTAGWMGVARKRLVGFIWALGLGLLTFGVWLLTAAWGWIGGVLPENPSFLRTAIGWVTPLVSLAVLPFVFALSFRTMAKVRIHKQALWRGGLLTALVFTITGLGARIYFSWNADTSAAQFAAGFFVLLLLTYMLSSAFFFGAHLTSVDNDRLKAKEEG